MKTLKNIKEELSASLTRKNSLQEPTETRYLSPSMKTRIKYGKITPTKELIDELKSSLGLDLATHQLRVINEAIESKKRGEEKFRKLLVWGTGTGKTIGGLGIVRALGDDDYALVVPAAIKPQFQQYAAKMKLDPNRVISYHQFANSPETPRTILIDEAHRLGSDTSIQSKIILPKLLKAKNVIMLTATPLKNNVREFAVLFSALKGYEIPPDEFEAEYGGQPPPRWKTWLKNRLGIPIKLENDYSKLRKAIEEIKNQIDYVPATTHNIDVKEDIVETELSDTQKILIKAIRTGNWNIIPFSLKLKYDLDDRKLKNLQTFYVGERQTVLSDLPFKKHPVSPDDIYQSFLDSPKLKKVFRDIENFLQNEVGGVMVYSNFPYAGLTPLAEALKRKGIPFEFFHGDMTNKERMEAIQNYNSGKSRVILIGPAGSEGVSLKNTRLIQILDPYWNDVRMIQAKARGLRAASHINLPENLRNAKILYYFSREPQDYIQSINSAITKIRSFLSTMRDIDDGAVQEKIRKKVIEAKQQATPETRLKEISQEKSEVFNKLIEYIREAKQASVNNVADKFIELIKEEIALSTDDFKKSANFLLESFPEILCGLFIDACNAYEKHRVLNKIAKEEGVVIPKELFENRGVLNDLLLAKYFSDLNNYRLKTHILRSLISRRPDEWLVDSYQGYTIGLTHIPTNFKFHLPKHLIEDLIGDKIRRYIEEEKKK